MTSARQRAASALVEIFGSPFLRAMTEPARIEIVRVLLVHGPLDVGELAGHVPQERSVVSRHLRLLEEAGLVAATRDGKRRVFALDGLRLLAELEAITAKVRTLTPACCPPLDLPSRQAGGVGGGAATRKKKARRKISNVTRA